MIQTVKKLLRTFKAEMEYMAKNLGTVRQPTIKFLTTDTSEALAVGKLIL
jgi:hypothetical protein